MRGYFTNPSRADDCFIPFSNFNNCIYAQASNGTVTNKIATLTVPTNVTRGLLVGLGMGMASTQYCENPTISANSTGVLSSTQIVKTGKILTNGANAKVPLYISAFMVDTIPNGTIIMNGNASHEDSAGMCAVLFY